MRARRRQTSNHLNSQSLQERALKNSPIGSHAPICLRQQTNQQESSPAPPIVDDCYLDHPYALVGRVVDPVSGNVSWQGKCVHLQRKDLEVLALLASNPGSLMYKIGKP
jgi:hypothetical protein